ncbi:MAG: hypothetical protein AB7I27_06535 [Bacteriovoracaceae bacterium]
MKKKLSKIALGMILFNISHAALAESTGTHGGDIIVTPTDARLRDLVDTQNCNWRSGTSILNSETELVSILNQLQKENPFLGTRIKSEIKKIKWCFTGTLKRINTNDSESEAITYDVEDISKNKVQVGIRLQYNVFVNEEALKQTSDRAYFYIHEAMHGFISDDAIARNQKVRSMVKAIQELYLGNIQTRDLDMAIKGNEVWSALSTGPVQQILRAVYDTSMPIQDRIEIARSFPSQKALNSKELFKKEVNHVKEYLREKEFEYLFELTGFAKFILLKDMSSDPGLSYFHVNVGTEYGNCLASQKYSGLMSVIAGIPRSKYILTDLSGKIVASTSMTDSREGRPYLFNYGMKAISNEPLIATIMYSSTCDIEKNY